MVIQQVVLLLKHQNYSIWLTSAYVSLSYTMLALLMQLSLHHLLQRDLIGYMHSTSIEIQWHLDTRFTCAPLNTLALLAINFTILFNQPVILHPVLGFFSNFLV